MAESKIRKNGTIRKICNQNKELEEHVLKDG